MFSNLAKVAIGLGGLPREPVRFRIAIEAALHGIMQESHQPTDWRKDQEIGQDQDNVRHDPADWKDCPHHREINRPNHQGKGEATSRQQAANIHSEAAAIAWWCRRKINPAANQNAGNPMPENKRKSLLEGFRFSCSSDIVALDRSACSSILPERGRLRRVCIRALRAGPQFWTPRNHDKKSSLGVPRAICFN